LGQTLVSQEDPDEFSAPSGALATSRHLRRDPPVSPSGLTWFLFCSAARYPHLSRRQQRQWARHQFEISARNFLLSTLKIAQQLRPRAKWGLYGYPFCHHQRDSYCSASSKRFNEKTRWLFGASSALFPSIYLKTLHSLLAPRERNRFVFQRLQEAMRWARVFLVPVFPYMKLAYDTYLDRLPFYEKV
jgi:Hyaluronidase